MRGRPKGLACDPREIEHLAGHLAAQVRPLVAVLLSPTWHADGVRTERGIEPTEPQAHKQAGGLQMRNLLCRPIGKQGLAASVACLRQASRSAGWIRMARPAR